MSEETAIRITEEELGLLERYPHFAKQGWDIQLKLMIAEVRRLRAVIQEVVDDDESREDGTGWGPDVTQLLKLKAALREPSTDSPHSQG